MSTDRFLNFRFNRLERIFDQRFSQLNSKLHKMTNEVQAVLDAVDELDTKVDNLKTAFSNQQTAIADLTTTVNSLTLSDADKSTLAAKLAAVQGESASIDSLLNPPATNTGS